MLAQTNSKSRPLSSLARSLAVLYLDEMLIQPQAYWVQTPRKRETTEIQLDLREGGYACNDWERAEDNRAICIQVIIEE